MGQAKIRGTFEQRRDQAIGIAEQERKRQLEIQAAQQEAARALRAEIDKREAELNAASTKPVMPRSSSRHKAQLLAQLAMVEGLSAMAMPGVNPTPNAY